MSSGSGQAPCRLQQNQVHRHGWSRAALRRAQRAQRLDHPRKMSEKQNRDTMGHQELPMTKENGDLMASSLSNMLMFTQMSPIPHQNRE